VGEIGGGFRVPDVMRLSVAAWFDVGTTNRTRAPPDYAPGGDAGGLRSRIGAPTSINFAGRSPIS